MKPYSNRFYRDMVEDNDIYDFGSEDDIDSTPYTDDDTVEQVEPSTEDNGEFGSED
jgi:hypothetical protein